jgi:hypothetical protein
MKNILNVYGFLYLFFAKILKDRYIIRMHYDTIDDFYYDILMLVMSCSCRKEIMYTPLADLEFILLNNRVKCYALENGMDDLFKEEVIKYNTENGILSINMSYEQAHNILSNNININLDVIANSFVDILNKNDHMCKDDK